MDLERCITPCQEKGAGAVCEKHVSVAQDKYKRSRTTVDYAVGFTKWFNMKVGQHQELALSSFLFAMIMDRLINKITEE